MATHLPVTENTLIAIKVSINDSTKKLKLPLKDLGADRLLPKLHHLLGLRAAQDVTFERYSDSIGGYVVLDPASPAVFKTLVRAAKAKLKLRLRATVTAIPGSQEKEDTKEGAAPPPFEPSYTRTATEPCFAPVRGSTAFDQRSVGPGIFHFREPPTAQQPKSIETLAVDEAPLPQPFTTTNKDFFAELASHGLEHELALRTRPDTAALAPSTWSVYCNSCDASMDNVHYHCSVCDDGDYDLCQACVDQGKLCPGVDHWLIKRRIDNGNIVASTTERLPPKSPKQAAAAQPLSVEIERIENISPERDMPGAFTDDTRTLNNDAHLVSRTCNNCIIGLPDHDFVTCTQCDDFDLCRRCHLENKHGHHPAHHFVPAVAATKLPLAEEALLPAGRNVRHNAICDGCDENIYGIRHKCFSCPDFDYCNNCITDSRHTHPRHRFAPIYEPMSFSRATVATTHHGIYCDGPLCKDKPHQAYIQGVRYKCVVCHDLDFCASCEALPSSSHNKTHPLIKFKTPVNNVTISTQNEDRSGKVRHLGDKVPPQKLDTNATTPVKTVADIQPSQKAVEQVKLEEKTSLPIRNLHTSPKPDEDAALEAHFVRDTIADGTTIAPATRFTQVWTLRNPGPRAWPAGCSVRFVGGDNMLNYDKHSSVSDLNEATESNVIGREVQPGEEVAFKVLLKTPLREGKSISYWRIKSADGTPFGHKLWCDVDVKKVELSGSKASPKVDLTSMIQQQTADQVGMANYWASYQQRMASIRLANAQRQAEQQRTHESRISETMGVLRAQMANTASISPLQMQADLRKQMEDFVRRTSNNHNMVKPASSDDGAKADMTVKAELNSAKATPEVATQEQKEESTLKDSQMIFPTLDRESPSSSTYGSLGSPKSNNGKAASVEDEQTEVAVGDVGPTSTPLSQVPTTPNAEAEEEAFEDISELEVLSADGEDESSDDGFMTDEEYDILDASDQETVASK